MSGQGVGFRPKSVPGSHSLLHKLLSGWLAALVYRMPRKEPPSCLLPARGPLPLSCACLRISRGSISCRLFFRLVRVGIPEGLLPREPDMVARGSSLASYSLPFSLTLLYPRSPIAPSPAEDQETVFGVLFSSLASAFSDCNVSKLCLEAM